MPRKLTQKEVIANCINTHGDLYDYSKFEYINSSTKATVICKKHGEFKVSPNKHISAKHGCTKCSKKYSYSVDEYIIEANKVHNNIYDYTNTFYTLSHNYIFITCKEHGEFKIKAYSHLAGGGCPGCKGTKIGNALRKSIKDRIKEFNLVHNNKYDYSLIKTIKTNTNKIDIICPVHGKFRQQVAGHRNGQGCPSCAIELSRKSHDTYINDIKLIHGDRYNYSLVNYTRSFDMIDIICEEHGIFRQTAKNHLAGNNCPKCINNISSEEIKIQEHLKSFNINYTSSDRNILDPYELDIYMPGYNLAIEINGNYWHSDKYKERDYHLIKTESCKEQGITLLHFSDDEINNKLEIVKSMINSRLNINDRIYARKCNIKIVSNKDAKEFMETTHLQGYAQGPIRLGLYYENDLVALMTFGKPRFNKKYEWELIRYCSKLNTNVIGGASKLLKHFCNMYSKNIITYANKRYSTGTLYKTLGFTELYSTSPSYVYHKGTIIYSRYQAQKHKLSKLLDNNFDAALTESENMKNAGFNKVYDCGNLVYAFTL